MIFIHDLYTMLVMGMGEKNPEINEKQGKKSPFGYPPIPPVSKIGGPTVFRGRKEPKTKPDLP